MAIKKANEKQLALLQSLLRKSKYNLTGKKAEDLNSIECSVIIDFLNNNYEIKTVNWKGEALSEMQLRNNKILIEDTLTYDENKVIGAASERAIQFLMKLIKEKKFNLLVPETELTAKVVYQLTNHLLDKEVFEDVDNYLEDTMSSNSSKSISLEELSDLNDELNINE